MAYLGSFCASCAVALSWCEQYAPVQSFANGVDIHVGIDIGACVCGVGMAYKECVCRGAA